MAQQIPVLLLVCQPQQGIDVSMLDPTIWTTPPHVAYTVHARRCSELFAVRWCLIDFNSVEKYTALHHTAMVELATEIFV